MHIGQVAGWGMVLAGLGLAIMHRLAPRTTLRLRVGLAIFLVIWCLLPGDLSPVFWLCLAFQSPSFVGMLLGLGLLLRSLAPFHETGGAPAQPLPAQHATTDVASSPPVQLDVVQEGAALEGVAMWGVAFAGVLLGYALVLDTFALFPVQWYAWGFGPLAVAVVAAVALLPFAFPGFAGKPPRAAWVLPVAVALFVLTRLPSGNVWDAVLDPFTWLALQVYLLRSMFTALRRSATRA
jgi:hypothetical protein